MSIEYCFEDTEVGNKSSFSNCLEPRHGSDGSVMW